MFGSPIQATKNVFGREPIFLWKLYWLHREKSILNTFIALCCLRKQNLLHLDYELFVYELSHLSGQLEESSIIISSVYIAELLKSPYFSYVCTVCVLKKHLQCGFPCVPARPSAYWLLERVFRTDSFSGPDLWGKVYTTRSELQSLISIFVITPIASGLHLAEVNVLLLGEWLNYICG